MDSIAGSPRITALADDATGALETGCRFAANGVPCEVWFEIPPPDRVSSVVIDTQSRHCAGAEAGARVRQSLAQIPDPGWVFKKTDSTLRGNIAAEIAGVLDCYGDGPVVYAPAYPAMGRTVHDGRLFVGGVPVERTHFRRDPLSPVKSGALLELFADSGWEAVSISDAEALAPMLAGGPKRRILICDGSTDDDIDRAAQATVHSGQWALAAGPAPFAGALARQLATGQSGAFESPQAGRGLIVCGSMHPVSLEQVRTAAMAGIPVAADALNAKVALRTSNWAILKPDVPPGSDPIEAGVALTRAAVETIEDSKIDALVLFGGETAYSLLRQLRVRYVVPVCEVLTGVSMSRVVEPRSLLLLAKAGGFGPPTTILDILQLLGHETGC